MVLEFKKKNIPPKMFKLMDQFDFIKYRQAKSNEVVEFYFLENGEYDGIQVERLQLIKY